MVGLVNLKQHLILGKTVSKLNLSAVSLRWRIVIAFAAVYLIWGSTYLAIHFAIETIPPYLMGGVRFLIAGGLLYAVLRLRGVPAPTRRQWRSTFVVGSLLLFGGNGGVMVAEQFVPSSLAALLIAIVPLWMVLLNWKWGDRVRPTLGVIGGVILGVIGIGLIAAPGTSADAVNPIGLGILIVASLSWSIGSLYSRRADLPSNALLSTAMEMLMGGSLMFVVALVLGQGGLIRWENVSLRSVASVGYLVIFGSLLGFSAYVWLLRVTTPAKVATYAFVNPVIAVFLGWLVAGEALSVRTLIAAAIIIAAVVLITLNPGQKPHAPQSIADIELPDGSLMEGAG
jgi:drug/metabolite transporter (DMT)-like permease